jgi:very-short-patch-repair endonuclease
MKKIDLSKFNWQEIQRVHDSGINFSDICIRYSINPTVLRRAIKDGYFIKNPGIFRMSMANRKLASDRMKKMRANGVGNLQHRKSIPCETFKRILLENGFVFDEEFKPLANRLFRIDIAFTTNKIGIEINGNQHYSAIGILSEYYQTRHNMIENAGWKLYELHYSQCFNETFISSFLKELENSLTQ